MAGRETILLFPGFVGTSDLELKSELFTLFVQFRALIEGELAKPHLPDELICQAGDVCVRTRLRVEELLAKQFGNLQGSMSSQAEAPVNPKEGAKLVTGLWLRRLLQEDKVISEQMFRGLHGYITCQTEPNQNGADSAPSEMQFRHTQTTNTPPLWSAWNFCGFSAPPCWTFLASAASSFLA